MRQYRVDLLSARRTMPHTDLIADAFAAFSAEGTAFPAMTLRGGDALDLDKPAPPFDVLVDAISDDYLEAHPWGTGWLDAASWRHYLPFMIEYALRHIAEPAAPGLADEGAGDGGAALPRRDGLQRGIGQPRPGRDRAVGVVDAGRDSEGSRRLTRPLP
jgi:hypothetical protein